MDLWPDAKVPWVLTRNGHALQQNVSTPHELAFGRHPRCQGKLANHSTPI